MVLKDEWDEATLRRAVVQRLKSLEAAGVTQLGRSSVREAIQPVVVDDDLPPHPAVAAESTEGAISLGGNVVEAPEMSLEGRKQQLTILATEVNRCTRCQELVENRNRTVFGVGNPAARLVFFGEAPGADEDRQGEPFVGRAGQLLNDILTKGMGLKREDVYIMNVIKCRPPGNRNPTSQEAENCRGFFEQQFELIDPEFICCLGAIAATTLLDTTQSIGRLRGRFHEYHGKKVLATYHPAYLLRNSSAKKEVWKDIQLLMAEMGLKRPG